MSIKRTNNTDSVQYFICHNGSDVFHPVVLKAGDALETGQPNVDVYETEAAFLDRLDELGISLPT